MLQHKFSIYLHDKNFHLIHRLFLAIHGIAMITFQSLSEKGEKGISWE